MPRSARDPHAGRGEGPGAEERPCYFPAKHHAVLAKEFAEELRRYGRIYMYRLRPDYEMYARPIDEYPARCRQAAAIMLMIQNNLIRAWRSIPTS